MSVIDVSLLDMVIVTVAVVVTMAIICCLCCVCIKLSDMKLKQYLLEMSRKKGVPLDLDKLDDKPYKQPQPSEPCAIVMADVGMVVAW